MATVKEHPSSGHTLPLLWNAEVFPVTASGIILRDKRWSKRKWIRNIGVDRQIKSMQLPVGRNCNNKENYNKRGHCNRSCLWNYILKGQTLISRKTVHEKKDSK